MFFDVEFILGFYFCVEGVDVVVIIMEWNEFCVLDFECFKEFMSVLVLVDLCNIYVLDEMQVVGFKYMSIG